jgi:hypothetical protein
MNQHADVEKARQRGTARAEKSAQSLLGRRWLRAYRIDDDVSWSSSSANKFEQGDYIFDVLEKKTLRPPGVLVHKQSSNSRHGTVLFICRERKLKSRRMKNVRTQVDRKTFSLLKNAAMRQLTTE